MKIFHYQAPVRNFGDDLNQWLWPRVWPEVEKNNTYDWLIGIGSVLDGRLGDLPGRKLVLGAGYRPGRLGKPPTKDVTTLAVRGRLTCETLGLDEELARGDPAVLVAEVWGRASNGGNAVGFMPHYQTSRAYPLRAAVEDAGLLYIDPEGEAEAVLQAVGSVDRLVTEAMHGAIVADALGVPWKRIGLYNHVREPPGSVDFKWADWASVYALDPQPRHLCELPITARGLVPRAIRRVGRNRRLRRVAVEVRGAADAAGFQLSNRDLCEQRRLGYLALLEDLGSSVRAESGRG